MTECTHLRCIGPVACPVDIPEKIGVWRWVFCELCGAYKQWDAREKDIHTTSRARGDESIPWVVPVQHRKPLHAVGVSVLLSMSDGCILLGKRKANTAAGLLSTPGGRLELGEDPFACARREFKEECGAELYGDIKLLAVRSHNRFGSGPYLMFYMHATGYTGIIENKEPDKCERWLWYDVRDLDYTQCTEPKDIVRLIEWPAARRHGD